MASVEPRNILSVLSERVDEYQERLDEYQQRLDLHDHQIGGVLREASAAHVEAAASNAIGRKVLDEVMSLRGDMGKQFDTFAKECELRHKPIDRRLDRIEDRDDTLEASSGMHLAISDPMAMVSRYEDLKHKIEQLEKAKAQETAEKESAQRRTQSSDLALVEVERERAKMDTDRRRALIAAYVTGGIAIIGAVAGAVVAILDKFQ